MIRFATDENFDGTILKQLHRRLSEFDVVRIQDTEMYQASDPAILEWAVEQDRVILTHDIQTMVGYAYDRVKQGLSMTGIILVHDDLSIGQAVDLLEVVIGAGEKEDFENQVLHIP